MATTRDFGETVQARLARDPAFYETLLIEAIGSLLAGEVALGKALLRDLVEATVGFDRLAADMGQIPGELEGFLAPHGEPTASQIFAVLSRLQQVGGVQLHVEAS